MSWPAQSMMETVVVLLAYTKATILPRRMNGDARPSPTQVQDPLDLRTAQDFLEEEHEPADTSGLMTESTDLTQAQWPQEEQYAEPESSETLDELSDTDHDEAGPERRELTRDEEEHARNSTALILTEVHPDDYTDGSCRLVEAFDGVKGCFSLLLPEDLSVKIQKAVALRRRFEVEQRKAAAKEEAVERFKIKLRHEKLNHESRIAYEATRDNGSDDAQTGKIGSLQEELEVLKLLSENMKATEANIELNRNERARTLAIAQAAVSAHLEEAFVEAQLMEPDVEVPFEPVPEFDLEEEFQTLRIQLREIYGGPRVTQPLDTSDDHLYVDGPVRTPAQESLYQASSDLWQARDRLCEAQRLFDTRFDTRAQEFQQNVEAEDAGNPGLDASVDDFDSRWVVRIQEITRDLIEAEEAVAAAKLAARAAGLLCEDDTQSSCFGDHIEDGLFLSCENDLPEAVAADPRVDGWFSDLSELDGPDVQHEADVDDWDFRGEVEISDSASAIVQGSERRRIDTWQQICRQARTM